MDSAGDVLLAGPAIRAVARGAGSVTLLCSPRGLPAAQLLPGIDRVVVHGAAWIDPEPEPLDVGATHDLVERLAELCVDEAIVLTSFHQSALPLALILRLARIPVVAAISEDYPGSLLDIRHAVADEIHEVERSLSLVGGLGYTLARDDDGRLQIMRSTDKPPSVPAPPYVAVHPGASVPARAWAPARCAELVAALADSGRNVVVTGSPDELTLTALVAGTHDPRVTNLGGATDFAMLAEVLADAECVVVGNTGPAHLAAAVGTPVVSLYAPTVPAARWRPWRVPHVLLGMQELPCAGCRARVCPMLAHPCLSSMTVADVLDAIARLQARKRVEVEAIP
jgi:ADP-heptose:LPS heptosyltransferase